jgi:hypothetical protein
MKMRKRAVYTHFRWSEEERKSNQITMGIVKKCSAKEDIGGGMAHRGVYL